MPGTGEVISRPGRLAKPDGQIAISRDGAEMMLYLTQGGGGQEAKRETELSSW
jgi:hypothetical protein